MRLVIDTNVVVSGLLWSGSPAVLLNYGLNSIVEFYSSEVLLTEFAATLGKRSIAAQLEKLGLAAHQVVSDYRNVCGLVAPTPIQSIAPDPDDDWVIATALAANADMIVTGDKPFLSIGSVGDLRIVGVAEALTILDGAR